MSKTQADKAIDAANRQLAYDFLDISRLAEDIEEAEMDLKGLLAEREQLQRDEELSLIKQQHNENPRNCQTKSRQNWRFMSG